MHHREQQSLLACCLSGEGAGQDSRAKFQVVVGKPRAHHLPKHCCKRTGGTPKWAGEARWCRRPGGKPGASREGPPPRPRLSADARAKLQIQAVPRGRTSCDPTGVCVCTAVPPAARWPRLLLQGCLHFPAAPELSVCSVYLKAAIFDSAAFVMSSATG